MKKEFNIKKTLKKYNVNNLNLADEQEYKSFVDNMLNKNYKNAPNILKIAKLDEKLQEALGVKNGDVFLSKKHFSHFRKDRKQSFNQDLPDEFLYKIPSIIQNTKEAYVDMKNNNFFMVTSLNLDDLAFLHFNVDELGNFIVTAKRAKKADLNKKEYKKVS